jgi:exodeoxyribonuclease V alpha subunit
MVEREPSLDHYFAQFLASRSPLEGDQSARLIDILERLSASLENGHSCLPLQPEEEQLLEPLLATDLLSRAEDERTSALVLRGSHLYLHRYYMYETRLAQQVTALATAKTTLHPQNRSLLSLLFDVDAEDTKEQNYQKQAAETALKSQLTIISGGPGTGKTTVVVKILLLLLDASLEPQQIGLAAPTGKAAMRLSESIGNSLNTFDVDQEILSAVPTSAQTLHRLLGTRQHSTRFIHNQRNPMGYDLVVVDEASMIDLAMMSKLVDALKPGARLILLGDKDQLSSVESGAVLGDLVASLPHNSVELKKTYRFDTGIRHLSAAINRADTTSVWEQLTQPGASKISLLSETLFDYIGGMYEQYMEVAQDGSIASSDDIHHVFKAFGRFQILCALHRGRRGVETMNSQVEYFLGRKGFNCSSNSWYQGRPVLITRNDYSLDLFNGDIGICLIDEKSGKAKVWFERSDGSLKGYFPNRLPRHETVYAMTIHKSQGSEFDEVVVVLPDSENRILSRELLYTGITRAKKVVRVAAEKGVLEMAVGTSNVRISGLAGLLRSNL